MKINKYFKEFQLRVKTFIKNNTFFFVSLILFNILYLVFALYFHSVFQESDAGSYPSYYQDIISGNFPPSGSSYWPPGLPFLIGLISEFSGDFFLTAKIIIVEFSVLFLFTIYITIKKIFNKKIALFTYIFIGLNYWMILFYFIINTDIPFASLIMLSIYFLIKDDVYSKSNLLFSSIFLGLATLIRWTGLFFIPIIILKFFLDRNIKIKKNIRLRQKLYEFCYNSLFYLLILFLVISPYLIANTIWHGSPFYTENINNIYYAIDLYKEGFYGFADFVPPTNPSWLDLFFGSEAFLFYQQWAHSLLFEFPNYIVDALYIDMINGLTFNLDFNFISIIFSYLIFGFIFIIYYHKFRLEKPTSQKTFLFLPLLILLYLAIISIGFAQFRFLIPIIPFLIAPLFFLVLKVLNFIFKVIQNLVLKGKEINFLLTKKRITYYISIIFSLVFVLQLPLSLIYVKNFHLNELEEFKIAGEFLRDKVDSDDRIIACGSNYFYYIENGIYIRIPNINNINEFLIEINSSNYLIICERIEVARYPQFDILLEPLDDNLSKYLEPIFNYTKKDRTIIIFIVL